MKTWEERGWGQEDLDKLELSFLNRIFALNEVQGVNATILIAHYMRMVGVHPDNYPLYLRIIEMKNEYVIDALIGDADPVHFFDDVQPNFYIIKECFDSMARAKRGGIYEKSLLVFLGLILKNYKNPIEGYRVFPLTDNEVNVLGKHLVESENQLYPLNQNILFILDKIADLVDPGRPEEDQKIISVASQANNIRGKFLDMTKSLNEAIPDNLLQIEDFRETEIEPTVQVQ